MDTLMFQKTVVFVDQQYIPVSLTCDFFGITYRGQIDKIKNDLVLKSEWKKTSGEMLFGDKRSRVCLTKKGFIRWIQLLSPQLVAENLREKLVLYQSMIFDWMYGKLETKQETTVIYARLKKLRSLYGKIGAEIQKCERSVKSYMEGHLNQLSLFKALKDN